MDFRGFSSMIKDVLKETSVLRNDKNGAGAYKYDIVILFARIWFLKAEIFCYRSSAPVTSSVEDFITALYEGTEYLRNSVFLQLEGKTDFQILKLVEQVPGQVEYLCQSEDSVGNCRVRDLLYKFLVQVMLFKAEWFLLELMNSEIPNLKNQSGTLREGLIFFVKSEINQPREEDTEDEKLILADFEGLAVRVISICNSSPVHDGITEEEAVKNMEFHLSDLLKKVQFLKSKLKELYFQIPQLSFPKTPGLGSIRYLLQNLKQLSIREHDSLVCATHQIEAIHGDLEFIICTHGHVFDVQYIQNDERIIDIHTRLVDAAYQVEFVIDSMALGRDPMSQELLWLYHLSEVIISLKMELIDYCENNNSDVRAQTDSYGFRPLDLQYTIPSTEKFMVGFNLEKEDFVERLTRGTSQLQVVSITGMRGIGKTTLAENVFNSPGIVDHFHIRLWCWVSQRYRKRDLLLHILNQITELTYDFPEYRDLDLCEFLYRGLTARRYLIVMDDVWSSAAWDDLSPFLPDDSCGSRILITSRLYNVVPNPHPLRPLSNDESWDLLKRMIFGKEECPEVLFEVSQRIARSCEGLPLAIVVVASHLVKKDKNGWEEIAESVSSRILNDQVTEYMNIFELHYQHLPDHLKECFLYFGVWPKDMDISVRMLLWLWIAEGFIHNVNHKSLEDLAEDCLMDLIERSLVIADKRRSDGKVKTCQVHDQILDFCLLKAKDAKFLQLISGEHSFGSSYDLHYEHCNPSTFINSEHRLSVCGDPEQFISSRPSGPFVRSLLFFPTTEMYAGCYSDLLFISTSFKLLKVLNLGSVNVGNSLENGIDLPVHLRYLAVGGDMDSIPSSLCKLQYLETLVVKGLMNKFVLPDTIWSMIKLRNIHVTNHCIFTLQNGENGSYSKLDSLVALSMPTFLNGEETNKLLMRFPNLRTLKCIFLEAQRGPMYASGFPELGSLYQLESLKISYSGRPLNTVELNLPSSLKKLTLSNFRLPWDQISVVGRLLNLEVLK